jgi:hypothetical protein
VSGGLDDDDEELFPGWVAVVPYPAMLGGTLAGQLVGILIDTAIGTRGVWIPAACSVVLEALVGSRFSGANGLPRLDWAQSLRRSVTYTVVLVCVSAPLLLWVGASHAEAVPNGVGLSFFTPTAVALALVVLAVATAIRAALLTVFASWSSKGGQ